MRAKTITHVEYEILTWLLHSIDLDDLKQSMCPVGDTFAEERFKKGAASSAKLIQNMCDRRKHKLPTNHPDYEVKQ
tara:strand:- start:9544 stop:9771 length:228 start_codon:yes stop_codon:yes gene_type:complete